MIMVMEYILTVMDIYDYPSMSKCMLNNIMYAYKIKKKKVKMRLLIIITIE